MREAIVAIQNLASTALRPSRLNAAGWCVHCLGRFCESARCIDAHARSVWEVCDRCGGTEYVNGHRDPATAAGRCDCVGGLVEATPAGASVKAVAPVVELRPERVFESWPAGGGAPVRWAGR
ncbi:hypothetical protein FMUAM8_07420 [Nocardia cyriacigeorgica]|nr:hypothetical protein FMUAM8_07420 [Nocardia cyriacigeorgica]